MYATLWFAYLMLIVWVFCTLYLIIAYTKCECMDTLLEEDGTARSVAWIALISFFAGLAGLVFAGLFHLGRLFLVWFYFG